MPEEIITAYPFITRDVLTFGSDATFELVVRMVTENTFNYVLRGITKDAPFSYSLTGVSTGATTETRFRIAEIPLYLTLIGKDSSARTNAAFAQVYLSVNGTDSLLLCQGQVGFLTGVSWPNAGDLPTLQTHGFTQNHTLGSQTAGQNYSKTTPAGVWIKLKAMNLRLVTDANAANRTVSVAIADANGNSFRVVMPAVQTASLTVNMWGFSGATEKFETVQNLMYFSIPPDFLIAPGSTVSTTCTNIQTTDQFSVCNLMGETFYAPI